MNQYLPILISTVILLFGVIDDLRSKKVHNKLVLVLAGLAVFTTVLISGFSGLSTGVIALFVAFALTLPMVLSGMLGAGDMKLLMAFGLSSEWLTVFWVLVYSIVFAGIFGLVRAVISGEIRQLVTNTVLIAVRQKTDGAKLHKIPFTVALLFGWLTHLSFTGWGGLL